MFSVVAVIGMLVLITRKARRIYGSLRTVPASLSCLAFPSPKWICNLWLFTSAMPRWQCPSV